MIVNRKRITNFFSVLTQNTTHVLCVNIVSMCWHLTHMDECIGMGSVSGLVTALEIQPPLNSCYRSRVQRLENKSHHSEILRKYVYSNSKVLKD